MPLTELAAPPSLDGVARWVGAELAGLFSGHARRSTRFVGGQTAADRALEELVVRGYARRRNRVLPVDERGATALSPYIRHGLLQLAEVDRHPNVADAPSADRSKYRSELMWQEYSRHWYAVLGEHTRRAVDFVPASGQPGWDREPWPGKMACVEFNLDEPGADVDGFAVDRARWRDGEDWFFRHLLTDRARRTATAGSGPSAGSAPSPTVSPAAKSCGGLPDCASSASWVTPARSSRTRRAPQPSAGRDRRWTSTGSGRPTSRATRRRWPVCG